MNEIKTDIFNGEIVSICMTEEEARLMETRFPNRVIYSPMELAFLKKQEPMCAYWLHEAKKQFPRSKIVLDAEQLKPKKKQTLREQLAERKKRG